jgi:WD40 repeat protein
MKYWAFLSYSHTDKKWGDWLHRALETYRVPRRLVGRESRDGKVPERVYPIFRDREELPVSADLGSNINEALGESRYLIVICSPRSAKSRWVGGEIKTFKKLGREDRILALIVDGEPNASDGKPGFKIEEECFHEAMRYRMVDGELSDLRSEPIAADAREGKDGKTNAKLKLLAGLLGVNYDDLKQREQERRLRRARVIVAASVALIAVFAALSVALFFKEREATRARDDARATLSRSDFLQAIRSIDEGKDFDALAQLTRSLRFNPANQAALCRLATLLVYRSYPIPVLVLRHDGALRHAQFSPDGKEILTLTNRVVRIWDAETGRALVEPIKHDELVTSAEFSPDGTRIVSASGEAQVWDAHTGKPIGKSMGKKGGVNTARFSPDGKLVVTASDDSTARIWEVETGEPRIDPIEFQAKVSYAEFSPDGDRILAVSDDHMTRVWNIRSSALPIISIEHGWYVAHFSPDGKRIVTAQEDGTARVWHADTGKPIGNTMKHGGQIYSAEFSPDGSMIVTASWDQTARVWKAETGEPLTDPIQHGARVYSAQFSPTGREIVTASGDQTAQIWDAQTGKATSEPMKHGLHVYSAEVSLDGKKLVTASADGTARVWNVELTQARGQAVKHRLAIRSVQFSPDGNRLVTSSKDNTAKVWQVETCKQIGMSLTHDSAVNSAEFSPDAKKILTASADKTARLWDAETGAPAANAMGHDAKVTSAKFSPDGKLIVTVSGKARVWDPKTGEPLTSPEADDEVVNSAEFSPDSQRLLTASKTARIWDVRTAKSLIQPILHDQALSVAHFSPDGSKIVTGSGMAGDGVARVWDSVSGRLLSSTMANRGGHYAPSVFTAEFSSDSRRVVTGEVERAQVWDAQSGKPVAGPIQFGREDMVETAQFSRDGNRVLTVTDTARVWDSATAKPLNEPIENSFRARFNPSGTQIVTLSNNEARVWDIAPVRQALPEWVLRLADAVAGEHLNDQGVFEPLNDSAAVIKKIREQLRSQPADHDWLVWCRWFLADRATRTVSPFSKITIPEYIENRIKENTPESLDEVEQLAIRNPELLKRIEAAKQSLPPKPERNYNRPPQPDE